MIVLPEGFPTNPDGSAKLSPLALAKALPITYTNGATGKITRELYFTPYDDTSGGEILDVLLELGPYGWTSFNNSPGLADLTKFGAEMDITGFGDQGFVFAPGEGYGGKTYADVVRSGGRLVADLGSRVANTRIAARCVNGKLTPLAGMESDDNLQMQQRIAFDIYYTGFAQPDPNAPPAFTPSDRET